ncbi:solute carrier family 22 member 2-like [Saccoglossus kowalevskii]
MDGMYVLFSRNSAVGVGHAFMFLGDIIAPFIMLLENLWYLAPISALSIPCIISALLILLLPDTMNKPVPDSIDELENSQRILESTTDGGEHMQLVVKDMHIP